MTKPFDPIALRIGRAYRIGLTAYVEAGKLLAEKKTSLKHGEWLPWLKANADALGFDSDRTAQRLIKLAAENPTLTTDLLDPAETQRITQALWGNDSGPTPNAAWGHTPTRTQAADAPMEWYTPPQWIVPVKEVYGGKIDLDPASCLEANSRWVKAKRFYTKKQDGLTKPWKGRVYLNGPFQAESMNPLTDKLLAERANGNCTEAVMLAVCATDTGWFQQVFQHADMLCFPSKRIRYIAPGDDEPAGNPGFSSAFAYFGSNKRKFVSVFREIGTLVKAL